MSGSCSVPCLACGREAWSGGRIEETADGAVTVDTPFGEVQDRDGARVDIDAVALLTAMADASCARQDCPHTTVARDRARARDPDALAARVAQLEADVAELRKAKT